jgi:taurine dioxygenase
METARLTGSLGAVMDGVDLELIDDAEFKELNDAVMAHQVVFLRNQRLTEEGHRALAARFGHPTVYPTHKYLGDTECIGYIEDTVGSPPKADDWHTDITFVQNRPKVAILCALVIPPFGGDTIWADLYGAWDGLSRAMQVMLEPLQVFHNADDERLFASIAKRNPERFDEIRAAFPGTVHPLARPHPVTGRMVLNLAGYWMKSIVGMKADESALLLEWLKARVENPNLQVRWSWHEQDVAIWDEYSTVHRALSDHYPYHRKMRRCTVDGEP